MHPDLSYHLHSPECNLLIKKLKDCHQEYPFKKFMGQCSQIDTQVICCLRNERKETMKKNKEKSIRKQ